MCSEIIEIRRYFPKITIKTLGIEENRVPQNSHRLILIRTVEPRHHAKRFLEISTVLKPIGRQRVLPLGFPGMVPLTNGAQQVGNSRIHAASDHL